MPLVATRSDRMSLAPIGFAAGWHFRVIYKLLWAFLMKKLAVAVSF